MTRHRHPLVAAVGLSLEADRRATLLTLLSFGLRPSIPILVAFLIARLVDAALAGDGRGLLTAAIAVAVAAAASAGTVSFAVELSIRMIEATSSVVDQRLMRMGAAPPGVEHLDDPDFLDRLEVLRQERVHLSEGADAFALFLGSTVRAVVTGVVLALVHPLMLLTPLLAVPSLLSSRRGQRRRLAAVEAVSRQARRARHLHDAATSVPVGKEIRLFGLRDVLRERHAVEAAAADRPVTAAVRRNLLAGGAASAFFAAGYALALLLVLREYTRGAATVGDLVLALGLVTLITQQVAQAVTFMAFLNETVSASRRLLDVEALVADAVSRRDGRGSAPEQLRSGLTLRGVSFRYPGARHPALNDINLTLPAGATVAVVGSNGSGKSTLIKVLAGLYRPTHGQVLLDGAPLDDIAPDAWYGRVSGCFQDFAKLEFVARESIGLGDLRQIDDEAAVVGAVAEGAATEVLAELPQGLATPLGRSMQGGVELSGGQWQRVALARARMRPGPCLLLLDEPTAAIDPLTEDALLSGYVTAARRAAGASGGVTLLASHRLSLARTADIIVVLDGGRIAERGTHEELMGRPGGLYHSLYEGQARAYA